MMKKLMYTTGAITLFVTVWCCTSQPHEQAGTSETETPPPVGLAEGDTLEISGPLVCAHCYALNQENTGHDHQLPQSGFVENCASQCASLGYPIAILKEGPQAGARIWVIRTSSQLFTDYMTKNAKIGGSFVTPGVIEPVSIQIETNGEWITLQ